MLKDVLARVEARLAAVEKTPTAASREAGLSPDAIRNMKRATEDGTGRKGVTTRTIEKLAPVLRTTTAWLLEGAGPENVEETIQTHSVPLVSWVSAGRMGEARSVMPGDEMRNLAVASLPAGEWIALQVQGDSMDRVAPAGSLIFVNRADTTLRNGKLYVVADDQGGATFKRFFSTPDRFQPYSTNPDHETWYPSGEVHVIGRVYRVVTELD